MKLVYGLLFLLNFAYAGNEVGNGGDVILCNGQKPKLLDFYEYEIDKTYKIRDLTLLKNESEIVVKILDQLKSKVPTLYKQLMARKKDFYDKSNFKEGVRLRDVLDSKFISVPKECILEQIAIFRTNPATREFEFFIDKDLFNQLDKENKAGLILHEIVYSYFSFYNEKNSIKVRQFVRYLFSDQIKKHSGKEIRMFFEQMAIPFY